MFSGLQFAPETRAVQHWKLPMFSHSFGHRLAVDVCDWFGERCGAASDQTCIVRIEMTNDIYHIITNTSIRIHTHTHTHSRTRRAAIHFGIASE